MTFYLSRSYKIDFCKSSEKNTTYGVYLNELSKKPTKNYSKMFTDSSVWMGYTDPDTKDTKYDPNFYSLNSGKDRNSFDSIFSSYNDGGGYDSVFTPGDYKDINS